MTCSLFVQNQKPIVLIASIVSNSDIEDFGIKKSPIHKRPIANVNKRKRSEDEFSEEELNKSWREILGNPPAYGTSKV